MTSHYHHLSSLQANPSVLLQLRRGIEKEGLRVSKTAGAMSLAPHPATLGSALTHSRITTDYSEALLELVTGVHTSVQDLNSELYDIHAFVTRNIDNEVIWNQSMPCELPPEEQIPVGWYGTSNSAMLKHVYRLGLAERYGKPMQCIAGIHYNFSFPDEFWSLINTPGRDLQEQRSTGYLSLIRNFMRESWLLMYLFGASPAVSQSFFQGKTHSLAPLSNNTLHLPYATSLRMSDIGYQNKAQSDLQLCYNDLDTFLARIYKAVTTPWPEYEAIGTHRDGKWIQLNTNILQIENEYYSVIRPKRVTDRGERPATALAQRGVQYVEVRCMDIDPFNPVGISAETSRFLDAFLLYCAVKDSPYFPDAGFCYESHENFGKVVKYGREPGLLLKKDNNPIELKEWALNIMHHLVPYAELLDQAYGGNLHAQALTHQLQKANNIELTPSAMVLNDLKSKGTSLQSYTLEQSLQHKQALMQHNLSPEKTEFFTQEAAQSIQEQKSMEQSDTETFEQYSQRFHDALAYSV